MKILKWVSYASRPLRVGELQEAIAFTPQDTEWTANNIPNSSGLIGHCANLIIEDMADQCVRFAHPSVKQFLESQPARFNPGQGELDCGELCIAYLSFSNFSLQIAKNTEVRYAIAPPDFAALLPASVNGLFSLATKWTSIGTLQTKPISFGFSQPSIATEEERYQFLNYAIENWAPQTKTITNGSPLWPRFLNLAMQKDSRCSLHPWGTKTVMSQKSHQHRLLSWAIKEDHLPLVKALITIESITAMRELCELPVIYGGIPALHYASQLGRCDQVELLKSYGKFERNQRTALSYAAENGHFDVVVSLFASSRKSQYWLLTPSDERTALRSRETLGYAIKNGHIQIVQFLVEQGFSLESPDKTEPFIGIAARYGHTAVVEYLISKRVFVDTENEYYKKTPLHFAAEFWHIETVDMLIRHGAAVHHKDNQGQNALMCAIFGKKEGTKLAEVRYLMEKLLSRVDIEDKDIHGRTALTQAAMGGHSRRDIVKILIEKGADIETQDNRHFTPLQWAYRSGARDEFSIRLLLENGAEPVEPDNSNITVSLDRCIAGLQVDSSGFHWVSG
ncbi:MAG: hypothetical protein M1814_005453 [Vezdaea aestivalis]|nr:MAG: hypothetical protein M1814_005453 [Vezdaea aestivalis]